MKSNLLDEILKAMATREKATAPDSSRIKAVREQIAARLKKKPEPAKVQAIPASEGKREDNSPYRKESRK